MEIDKLRPIPMDTPWEIMKIRHKIYQKMSIEQKAKITFDMCDSIREISKIGIKNRHPEYTEEQVKLALIKLTIGRDLFSKAFPGVEIKP